MRRYPPGVYDNLPGNKCSFEPIHPIDIRAITSGSGNLQISGGSYKGTKEKNTWKTAMRYFLYRLVRVFLTTMTGILAGEKKNALPYVSGCCWNETISQFVCLCTVFVIFTIYMLLSFFFQLVLTSLVFY